MVPGETTAVGEIAADAGARAHRVPTPAAPAAEGSMVHASPSRRAPCKPFDIGRIVAETGRRPRPMRDAVHGDWRWVAGRETA